MLESINKKIEYEETLKNNIDNIIDVFSEYYKLSKDIVKRRLFKNTKIVFKLCTEDLYQEVLKEIQNIPFKYSDAYMSLNLYDYNDILDDPYFLDKYFNYLKHPGNKLSKKELKRLTRIFCIDTKSIDNDYVLKNKDKYYENIEELRENLMKYEKIIRLWYKDKDALKDIEYSFFLSMYKKYKKYIPKEEGKIIRKSQNIHDLIEQSNNLKYTIFFCGLGESIPPSIMHFAPEFDNEEDIEIIRQNVLKDVSYEKEQVDYMCKKGLINNIINSRYKFKERFVNNTLSN